MFRPYFVGKLLHRANRCCTYLEFPGASLIRQQNTSAAVVWLVTCNCNHTHQSIFIDTFGFKSSCMHRVQRCLQPADTRSSNSVIKHMQSIACLYTRLDQMIFANSGASHLRYMLVHHTDVPKVNTCFVLLLCSAYDQNTSIVWLNQISDIHDVLTECSQAFGGVALWLKRIWRGLSI